MIRCVLRSTRALAFGAILAGAIAAPFGRVGAAARPITEMDLFKFVWIADPQISPDGRQVAFVRVVVNEKKDGYDTALWVVEASGKSEPRALTAGPRDLAPRWSPDGATIAFLRALEQDGKPQPPQIFVLSMRGGEARALTDVPRAVGPPIWAPDGTRLAFTSTLAPEDLEKQTDPPARKSDVRVITKAIYRSNGSGYADPSRRSALWIVGVGPGVQTPTRLTDGRFDVGAPAWSRDGSALFFTSSQREEPYYDMPDADLFKVPARGGDVVRVASIDGVIGAPVLSPDGTRVAFRGVSIGRAIRSYYQPDLFVLTLGGSEPPRNLTERYDYDIAGGLTGDQHAPRGSQPDDPMWTADGTALFVTTTEKGVERLQRIDVTSGSVTPVTTAQEEVIAHTSSGDRSTAVILVSTPRLIGDLERLDLVTGRRTRLTRVNEALFSELTLTPPEDIWYTSFDGRSVQTWVQKPPDFDPGRKYPVILNIHGGPHAAYGYTFDHEFQWMAAKGYLVVYPNPRGSTSYGQEFGNLIQYRYPGDDAKDLLAAVDEVVRRGWADPHRLGVTGGSGGGVLTNWIITQTDRFGAAVSQRSIADWSTLWYTSDFALFQPTWFRGAPWQDPKDFAARSAITFVDRVKTPLMLIEGEQDFRTPPAAGGEQMFRALKYRRIPTVMVQFPGENHELSRSGQPWHRIERLQHIVLWFDKYLQGKKVGTYDE
jgi:dipeptidyl aminopeptidase/acylaminoacyl peptidase